MGPSASSSPVAVPHCHLPPLSSYISNNLSCLLKAKVQTQTYTAAREELLPVIQESSRFICNIRCCVPILRACDNLEVTCLRKLV